MIVLTAAALLLSSAAAVVAALELWLCGYSLWTDRMDVAVVRSVPLVLATLVVWLQSSPAFAQAGHYCLRWRHCHCSIRLTVIPLLRAACRSCLLPSLLLSLVALSLPLTSALP